MQTRGAFISFEGGEGAGKSTQIQLLAAFLRKHGKDVVVTREPGGSPGAELIRNLLVTGDTGRWHPVSEALLLYAARKDHVERLIEPALAQGRWVLSDRFFDSTTAYQGYGQGLDKAWLENLRKLVLGDFMPNLTLLLDLPVSVGLTRAIVAQRYEKMGEAFHERLRQGYLQTASADAQRCMLIDASQSAEQVSALIEDVVTKKFHLN